MRHIRGIGTDVKVMHFIIHQKIHRVVDYKDPILNNEKKTTLI